VTQYRKVQICVFGKDINRTGYIAACTIDEGFTIGLVHERLGKLAHHH